MDSKRFIDKEKLSEKEKQINNYMDKIAEALCNKRASAFVGTGFSLNATKKNDKVATIPMWNQVGKLLIKELNLYSEDSNIEFEDPIRLANLYEAEYTTAELNEFFKKIIDDEGYVPNSVHEKFLELDWNDIYTTNYDTLLERAAGNINRKYSIVLDDQDLPSRPKPRIVKLHGSFNNSDELIMTTEQYRTYKSKHAVFVNTVQQSFIEDTVVLFGFSGADPNFIRWTGWVRDNLGDKFAKIIYLVSVKPVSQYELSLFKKQNIKVIDISDLKDSDGTFLKTFTNMFDYWNQFPRKIESPIDNNNFDITNWLNNLSQDYKNSDNEIETDIWSFITRVTNNWTIERLQYPGCPVLSQSQFNILFWNTKNILEKSYLFNQLRNDEASISFLYELDWRWNLCNLPLFKRTIDSYLKVLNINEIESFIKNEKYTPEIQNKAIYLLISILKATREDGNIKLCTEVISIINNFQHIINFENNQRFYYEKILFALSQLKYQDSISLIENWNLEVSYENCIWLIKKAGLLAEIGKESQSIQILLKLLSFLKEKQPYTENSKYDLSIESIINWLILWIAGSKRFDKDFNTDIDLQEIRDRNKIIEQFDCDIFEIIKSYKENLHVIQDDKEIKDFDGSRKRTIIESREIPYNSFILIYILEKIGFPCSLNNSYLLNGDSLLICILNILQFQPQYALTLIIRSYDEKIVESTISRDIIQTLSTKELSDFVELIINSFDELKTDLSSGSDFLANNYCNRLIKTYPEIISRLCEKVNTKTKNKICSLILSIFDNDLICRMPNIENFIRRFSKSLTVKDKSDLIKRLIKIKAPTYRPIDESRVLNPFFYLYPKNQEEIDSIECNVNQTTVTKIINCYAATNDAYQKKWYLTILISINRWKLLDDNNLNLLGKYIWETDKDIFNIPRLAGFYKSNILLLPHPQDIDVEKLYLEMLLKTNVPIVSKSTSIYWPQDNSWADNILQVENDKFFSIDFWKSIIEKISDQKKEDEKILLSSYNDPFESRKNAVLENFRYSSQILGKAIVSNIEKFKEPNSELYCYRDIIMTLLDSFKELNVECFEAVAVLSLLDESREKTVYILIKRNLASFIHNDVVEALNVISMFLNLPDKVFSIANKKKLIVLLADAVYWQTSGDLEDCLKCCSYIFKTNNNIIDMEFIEILSESLINIRKPVLNNDDLDIAKTVTVKSAAAHLAYEIYCFCKENNKICPTEISNWEKISKEDNEFTLVKNQWIIS